MGDFFSNLERGNHAFAWEPRGKWTASKQAIADVCELCDLIHCVDPLRDHPVHFGRSRIAYFRLHGFGKPSMYHYTFSAGEMKDICALVHSLPDTLSRTYVFFNNVTCYGDALKFAGLMQAE
jgi:uncharacterized protein YecE (DUF72 family)